MTLAQETILATDRLTMRFGGLFAVSELDLGVREGAIHSIIGPNGAGKTTVFNCIMQNLQISAGKIWFRGERIDGLTPDLVAAAGVSRTYQNIRLFRNVTAMENLLVGMHLHLRSHWWGALLNSRHTRQDEEAAHAKAIDLLQFVGLRGRGDVLAHNLAYGEQRRLEIGRALATEPKLIMLDEPTAGMNPRETSEMMEFIRKVRDSYGATILLIEHQMRVVMGMSDTVTVLDHGSEIDEVHVFYDNIEALKGVSLAVEARQIVTLVGANGAGKTTTLRAVSGLLHPRRGEIRVDGESLAEIAPHEIAAMG